MSFRHFILTVAAGALWLLGVCNLVLADAAIDEASETAPLSAEQLAFFETKIRPVLVEKCYSCHSAQAETLQGGLLLDSRASIVTGGDSGPAAVPGNPDGSLLLQALRYETYEMPPSGQLPANEIADFERWIAMGMPDPRRANAPVSKSAIDLEQGRVFWCFQPIVPHQPPPVENVDWPHGDIDHYLLARLEAHAIEPATDADRATWLRRVTFDLIGLPPTREQIEDFLRDSSPQAVARVVDRLLASPHFGERWGRHWLDVARFAESSGGGRTIVFKDAWRYRDYVIDSINRDKPLDRFLVEQIAGDLLPHATVAEQREHLIATAYLLLGAHNYEEQDKRSLEMDVVDEQLDTIGRGLLGMTLACARCHDHKFDPIPTEDYYALAGIFRSTHTLVHANVSTWATRTLPVLTEEEAAAVGGYETTIATMEQKLARATTEKKLANAKRMRTNAKSDRTVDELKRKLAQLRKAGAPKPTAMAVRDAVHVEDCRICIRGSVHHRGPEVPRGVLRVAILGSSPAMPPDESGRRELAEWIASPQNPLTARVYVNRVWAYLFGAGLVRTLDNFGTTGEPPSHPELLDHLAHTFINDGWSTKRLIRRIVLTRAYRMNTDDNSNAAAIDPENRLLWRMNRRRLAAESLRDAMLTVSGQLDARIGGPNIHDPKIVPTGTTDRPTEYDYVFADTRRSVYTPAFRNRMHELFEVFDFANQNSAVAQRDVTTVVPQALLMLNSTFVMQQARAAAERALANNELTDEQRVERAFREALGRSPSDGERKIALATVAVSNNIDSAEALTPARVAAWEQLFQALFGCIDFRYLE
jgi:hypothetical protein